MYPEENIVLLEYIERLAKALERVNDHLAEIHDTLATIASHSERLAIATENIHDDTEGIGTTLDEYLPLGADQVGKVAREVQGIRLNS